MYKKTPCNKSGAPRFPNLACACKVFRISIVVDTLSSSTPLPCNNDNNVLCTLKIQSQYSLLCTPKSSHSPF